MGLRQTRFNTFRYAGLSSCGPRLLASTSGTYGPPVPRSTTHFYRRDG